jgi:hypothetical protein
MSASEKKNYTVKFYVERTYEVEFDFRAPDQETANQMAHDMANSCDEFPNEMIGKGDDYSVGEIEVGFVEETETNYACVQSVKVAEWCETWEEEQAEDEDEDEEDDEEVASE